VTKYDAPDSFEVLHMRFMSLLCRLQTLDGVLGNGALLPIELQPAAYCFAETVKEVAQLYEDFEAWYPPRDLVPPPGTPIAGTEQGTCTRCDGEGCAWCEPEEARTAPRALRAA